MSGDYLAPLRLRRELRPPAMRRRFVVMFSGGAGSWGAAKRTVERHGADAVTLLFADTLIEDEDLYRYLDEASENTGAELVRTADGRDPWEVFFDNRFLGNTRVDLCSRVLKRELMLGWLKENRDPADTTVVLGFGWEEPERFERAQVHWGKSGWRVEAPMTEKPYLSREEIFEWLLSEGIEPPRLYELGFEHNNPMAGETRVLTSEGTRTLAELAGTAPTLLGRRSRWTKAEVQSRGVQPLRELTVERHGRRKVIHATPDHRWYRYASARGHGKQVEITTEGLRAGDRLVSMYPRFHSSVRPSPFGIAHGIVFGDGTRPRYHAKERSAWNPPANVVLCGDKDRELLRWFPNSPTAEVPGVGVRVSDLPHHFKERPALTESRSYLLGWLAGYFAADGSVSAEGDVVLASADRETLEFTRDAATLVGLPTLGIGEERRVGLGRQESSLFSLRFMSGMLPQSFYLLEPHRRRAKTERVYPASDWRVVSVVDSGRREEVFCPTVPSGHAFTLEDNILTGNCGGFCIKAGQAQFAHLLRTLPDRYRFHEKREQEFREFIGKDVSILRDRRGGEMRPLTLRAFREQLEAQPSMFDAEDFGGACSCMDSAFEATADLPEPTR